MDVKPCPFCGGVEIDFQTGTEDREGWPRNVVCVTCVTCGACGPWEYCDAENETTPVKLWNGRKG